MSSITLYDLERSRSIRIAWLLEELQLPYTLKHGKRVPETGSMEEEFRQTIGTKLGKAPTLMDGDLTIQESGAITEYLCEKYDHQHGMIPSVEDMAARCKVREFMWAAEGTMMMHTLPYVYAKRASPEAEKAVGPRASKMIRKDLDWMEWELERKGGGWLVGSDATAADTMMAFSIQLVFMYNVPGEGYDLTHWKRIKEWLDLVNTRKAYRRAAEKTEFILKKII